MSPVRGQFHTCSVAIASMILGDTPPSGTPIASLVFGFADALGDRYQFTEIAPQRVLMQPYLLTRVALTPAWIPRPRRRVS